MTVRGEVLEHLVQTMRQAEADGQHPLTAAEAAYPGTPSSVLGEAIWLFEERKAESWWQTVEKTIDGEIVRQALLSTSPTASPEPGDPSHG